MKIVAIAVITGLALSGCVSVTQPVSVGPDTYMMGLGAHGGFSSDAELLAQTMRAAGEFCASMNRMIEVQSSHSSGVQMWTPQSNEVIFKCIARPPRS